MADIRTPLLILTCRVTYPTIAKALCLSADCSPSHAPDIGAHSCHAQPQLCPQQFQGCPLKGPASLLGQLSLHCTQVQLSTRDARKGQLCTCAR